MATYAIDIDCPAQWMSKISWSVEIPLIDIECKLWPAFGKCEPDAQKKRLPYKHHPLTALETEIYEAAFS